MERSAARSTVRLALRATTLVGSLLVGSLGAGCARTGADVPEGRWQFEAVTLDGFTRSCAPMRFERDPTFALSRRPTGRVHFAFDDADRTALTLRDEGSTLVGRLTMPTSEIGRPCGRTLQVDVRLRVEDTGGAPVLAGRWQPVGCDVCPGVDLRATPSR